MNHYEEAKKLLEPTPIPDPGIPAHSPTAVEDRRRTNERNVEKAKVHAALYLGEQMEALAGVFATAQAEGSGPDALTREQYGMGGERG